jgi:hypothetical protein
MKTIKKFEFPVSSFGQSTHDWDAILAAKVARESLGKPGPAVEVVEGADFKTDVDQFVGTIRNQAAKRHLKVKVSKVATDGKPTSLYVQVADMTDEEAAASDARIESAKERGNQRRLAKKAAGNAVAGTVPPTAQAS